jgi:hypothetical protein
LHADRGEPAGALYTLARVALVTVEYEQGGQPSGLIGPRDKTLNLIVVAAGSYLKGEWLNLLDDGCGSLGRGRRTSGNHHHDQHLDQGLGQGRKPWRI